MSLWAVNIWSVWTYGNEPARASHRDGNIRRWQTVLTVPAQVVTASSVAAHSVQAASACSCNYWQSFK
jgi:hypothetical protein